MEILKPREEAARRGGPRRSRPEVCDWCDEKIDDMKVEDGKLKIRLHELSILDDFPDERDKKRERDYVKVKVRCAECGYVNIFLGYRPLSGSLPLR